MRTVRTLPVVLALLLAVALVVVARPAPSLAQAADDALAEIVPFEVTTEDGDVLRGHVYLPTAEEPLATVLDQSPYWNTNAKGPSEGQADAGGALAEGGFLRHFLEADFAVALVNMRGTGESDGCFHFGGPTDWSDAALVVETLADQPWSNGNIGMYGLSFEGWSQWMAIAGAPPSLKATVPGSGVIDLWSLLTRRGAPLVAVGPATVPAFTLATSQGATEPEAAEHATCPNLVPDAITNAELAWNGDKTEFFQDRDMREHIADTEVPAFVTNGLLSPSEGHILQFEGLWDLLRSDRSRMLLSQTGHAIPTKDDFDEQTVAWFDHYLRGGPLITRPGVVEYQDDTMAWHTADQWPPPAREQTLHLSDGTLTGDPDAVEESALTFQSADADPGLGGPPQQSLHQSACGPYQALYVSEPVTEDLLIAGNYTVDLTIESSLPGGNFAAMLVHTPNDGSVCPDGDSRESGRALMDLQHSETPGQSQEFPTGEPVELSLTSHPLATVVPAGHRLVLAIGGGAVELNPDQFKPQITVHTGPDVTASLTLPLVDGSLPGIPEPPEPPDPPEAPEPSTDEVRRVAGETRLETAVGLSREAFESADAAVLARVDDFPDALAASGLAAELDAPVLLTPSGGLDPLVAEELERLGVEEAYLMGGTAALSPQVEADLDEVEIAHTRIGGAERFETAALIAEEMVALGGPVEEAIVALGSRPDGRDAWPDALAAGNLAAAARAPVVLTRPEELPEPSMAVLDGLLAEGDTVFVAGGTEAVGAQPEQALSDAGFATERLAGQDRYGTAVAIVQEAATRGADVDPVLLASGELFADALVAGPAAQRLGGVMLLVHPDDLDDSAATAEFLEANADAIATAIIAGGPGTVSDQVFDQVQADITDTS